ncbi:MAG: TonB-dependent receptor [Steroidobacteraceae bacterium]
MRKMAIAVALGCLPPVALAQAVAERSSSQSSTERSAELADDRGAQDTLSEVIVSARRIEERSLTVPITITSFDGAELDRTQLQAVDDLVARVPSLQMAFDPNRGNDFQMRGVRRTFQGDAGVVTYMAEAPLNIYGNPPLFDLASVEVLKGPQGTLFGRNSNGGAVLFVPQRPKDSFGGEASIRIGNYDLREITGVLNVPVNDKLSFRLADRYTERSGLQKNLSGPDVNSMDRNALRVSALFTPNDWLENYTIYDRFYRDEYDPVSIVRGVASCPASLLACLYSPPTSTFLNVPSLDDVLAEQDDAGKRKVHVPDANRSTASTYSVINHTQASFGDLVLRNILSYQSVKQKLHRDLDSTRIGIYDFLNREEHKQTTEELQLRGTSLGEKLQWVTGVFYSDNEDGNPKFPGSTNRFFHDLPPGLGLPLNPRTVTNNVDSTSKAIYGQFTYDLEALVSGLKFTAGGRYTWDKKKIKGTDFSGEPTIANCNNFYKAGPLAGQPLEGTDPTSCVRSLDDKFDAPSWNVNLEYEVNANWFVYAATRRGYKSGNFNVSATGTEFISYDPETLTDYEIGTKSEGRMFDMPYRLNLAAYTSTYKDIQTQQVTAIDSSLQILVVNAGRAKVKGVEVEATIVPLRGLEIGGYYALTDGEYTEFERVIGSLALDLTDKALLAIPRETAGANVRYTVPLGPEVGDLALSGLLSYSSGATYDYASTDGLGKTSPLTLVDATVEWMNVLGYPLDAMFFVKNLTDKTGAVSASDTRSSLMTASMFVNDPRTYGVQLNYKF